MTAKRFDLMCGMSEEGSKGRVWMGVTESLPPQMPRYLEGASDEECPSGSEHHAICQGMGLGAGQDISRGGTAESRAWSTGLHA